MTGSTWTDAETEALIALYNAGVDYANSAKKLKRTYGAVHNKLKDLRSRGAIGVRKVISSSQAPILENALTATGDILILPDVEAPYHHAEWINKCIDLAMALNVKQLCVAGDFVHFENFSQWAGGFTPEEKSAQDDPAVRRFLEALTEDKRGEATRIFETLRPAKAAEDITGEMSSVRKIVSEFTGAFETIYYIMGNHEDRKVRLQGFSESVGELKKYLSLGDNWIISPYYYMFVDGEIKSRIEHPKGASANYAVKLAVQHHQHVFMGHSHRLARQKDPSGDFWAVQMGHCVDERRLQYVMQRSAIRDAHCLGAVLYYDGYPFLLEQETPFQHMRKMAR